MGRQNLNLAEEEFWGLTLKELNALIEKYRDTQDWLNYRGALICAVIANTVRDPRKRIKPFEANDFMPKKRVRQQTAVQMLATARMLNAAFGGNVKGN